MAAPDDICPVDFAQMPSTFSKAQRLVRGVLRGLRFGGDHPDPLARRTRNARCWTKPDAKILQHFNQSKLASARQSSQILLGALALARMQSTLRPYFFSPAPIAQPI
jgi:hypothetical protein